MHTFFVQHRSPHHAGYSGYDRLLDHYPMAENITGQSSLPYIIAKWLSRLTNQKAGLYNSSSVLKDFELYKALKRLKGAPACVHYLNAERDIRFVVKYKKYFKNVVFCGTFHKPPHILDWRVNDPKFVKHLDGAIVVGRNQLEYVKQCFGIPKVSYIPHGVDTTFFYPDFEKRLPQRLLFVGQHLRDFETLNYCVPRLAEQIKDLQVHVIIHPAYKQRIQQHNCITILDGLTDEALRLEYQQASMLFLPMLESTACNSILEALACGLPILTTNVGGNQAYLEKTQNILIPIDKPSMFVDEAITLLKDLPRINELSILSRKIALEYDWKIISDEVLDFHNMLNENRIKNVI